MAAPLARPKCPHITARVETHAPNRLRVNRAFPDMVLTRYNPNTRSRENFSTAQELRGRRVVVFTVPGAFTPVCTTVHLGGFKKSAERILRLGIHQIVCLTADNADVAHAWNIIHGSALINMWPDPLGRLIDEIGLGVNLSGDRGLAYAFQRSAMVINDRKVEWLAVEENPADSEHTDADAVCAYLEGRTTVGMHV